MDDLFAMLCVNAEEALGPEAARAAERWRARLPALAAIARPVLVDGRLHEWEWLDDDGTLLKTDAVDHSAGHDLVGPQDIAWDVAGAAVEFALDPAESDALRVAVERHGGGPVDPDLVGFMEAAYAAFQLGIYTMAAGGEGAEAERLRASVARYRAALAGRLLKLRS